MPKIRNRTEFAPVSTPSIVLLWHPRRRRVSGFFPLRRLRLFCRDRIVRHTPPDSRIRRVFAPSFRYRTKPSEYIEPVWEHRATAISGGRLYRYPLPSRGYNTVAGIRFSVGSLRP